MAEQIVPIEWPFGGLSENLAYGSQEPGTARELVNMRALDHATGRLRGASRAGLSKYNSSALKTVGTKVQDLTAFFNDNRQVTYSAIASGSETITWDEITPSKTDCLNVKVDRQGNAYALDGDSGIVKFSADGKKLWQLAVPVEDENHVIRALWVDEFDLIYVGVSTGGDQAKAKLFAFEQLPDDKTEKLWEVTTEAYIEDIKERDGKLYTVQNRPDRKKSYVRIYEDIDSVQPLLTQQWRVPHPVNSVAIKSDSSVIVACEANGDTDDLYLREPDPKFPEASVDSVDWTPPKLENWDRRSWAWLYGDIVDQADVADDIGEGVEILQWRDATKNVRHMYAALSENDEGPKLAMDSWLEHKGIRWSGPATAAGNTHPLQALRSLPNSSTAKQFADQQRTLVPGYTGSQWALFMVLRPSQSDTDVGSRIRWVWGQDRDNASSGSDDHILFINADDSGGNTLGPSSSPGDMYWYTGETAESGGDGAGGVIKSDSFVDRIDGISNIDGTTDVLGNVVIVTMVCDGSVTNAVESYFRINGWPIDKFQSRVQETLRASYLGIWRSTQGGSTNPSTGVSPYLGDILEIVVLDRKNRYDDTAGILTADSLQFNDTPADQTINELTVMEGYLAHKYGVYENLPYGSSSFPHPFGITGSSPDYLSGPPNQAGDAVSTNQALANKRYACVVKYSPEGKIQWCANEMASGDGSRPGGFGYAVAVNSDGNIYSVGPNPTNSGGTQQVRMIIDNGTTFSLAAADGAWSASYPSSANQDYKYPKVDVDAFDNLYVPYNDSGAAASVRVYQKDGTVLHSHLLAQSQQAYAVAVDKRYPDYRSDLTVKRGEHVLLATDNEGVATNETLHKIRLVSTAQSGDSPRELITLGVSGGDIKKFTASAVTTPTGGSSALDSSAYVQSTTLFRKAYWTDGRQYREYHPITNVVLEYKSESAGAIPSRCALIESWRGRIVLARSADEPHNWFLSRKDEPNDWDFFPPVPSEVDAVAGNNSPAGLCPDIINSVVPYSEDILVFGGDHSIWALVGDPAAGGRLELVSDTTGMSFGRPWCKDPNGVLYFFGSQGGLYRWVPGARPERVSINKIERQLQNVDLSTHYIRLVYNHKDEGIHILQCPFGAGGTQVNHWFYELRTDSFAKDTFGNVTWTNVQPTVAMVLDGDDYDDRTVLFGCEDGYVRKWDRAAKNDDVRPDGTTAHAIDSLVTIGPLQGQAEAMSGHETQFSGLTVVLGEQDDGAKYELFASESPDSIGLVRTKGTLLSGRNPPKWDRVTGAYCWLRLRNSAAGERLSYERGYIRAAPAGVARPKVF